MFEPTSRACARTSNHCGSHFTSHRHNLQTPRLVKHLLPYHHFAVTLKLSLSFIFFCVKGSRVSFSSFCFTSTKWQASPGENTVEERNPSSGPSSSFFLSFFFPPPSVRSYFASFLEMSVTGDWGGRDGGEKKTRTWGVYNIFSGLGLSLLCSLDLHWIERGETVVVFGERGVPGTHCSLSLSLPSLIRLGTSVWVSLSLSLHRDLSTNLVCAFVCFCVCERVGGLGGEVTSLSEVPLCQLSWINFPSQVHCRNVHLDMAILEEDWCEREEPEWVWVFRFDLVIIFRC